MPVQLNARADKVLAGSPSMKMFLVPVLKGDSSW
jgi:hypothetical protein